jgi:hypothetical protein
VLSIYGSAGFNVRIPASRHTGKAQLVPPMPARITTGGLAVMERYKFNLKANIYTRYHLIGSRVETRRFQAMGQPNSTCTALP